MLKGRERLALAVFFSLFLVLSFLHLLCGYADNGDFSRTIGFIFEKPSGFEVNWPAAGTEAWQRRFFSVWHEKWDFVPGGPGSNFFSFSFYKIYLILQVGFCKVVSGDAPHYSMILGSIPSRLIAFMAFAALVLLVRKALPAFAAWAFAVLLAVIFLDTGWAAFYNSFYEEQMALLLLPVIGFLMLRLMLARVASAGYLLLACAAMLGSAKTAYFYLPILTACFALPFVPGRQQKIRFLAFLLFCQIVSVLPVALGKYGEINSYHSFYYGAVKVMSKEDAMNLTAIGDKPVLAQCIGISAFEPLGAECIQAAQVSYKDTLKFLILNPGVGANLVARVFSEGRKTGLDYLGRRLENASDFSGIWMFNLMPKAFAKGLNLCILLVAMATAGVLAMRRLRPGCDSAAAVMRVGVFMALFGFSQYAVALGDGLYEITKHLIIGNYALALSLPFMLAAWLSLAWSMLQGRLPASKPHLVASAYSCGMEPKRCGAACLMCGPGFLYTPSRCYEGIPCRVSLSRSHSLHSLPPARAPWRRPWASTGQLSRATGA